MSDERNTLYKHQVVNETFYILQEIIGTQKSPRGGLFSIYLLNS